MGCLFSCFDVNDPLDNTQNANNANDGNRIIIPNLYNKVHVLDFSSLFIPYIVALVKCDRLYMSV